MDASTLQSLATLATELTTTGIALLWVWTEQKRSNRIEEQYNNLTEKLLDRALRYEPPDEDEQ